MVNAAWLHSQLVEHVVVRPLPYWQQPMPWSAHVDRVSTAACCLAATLLGVHCMPTHTCLFDTQVVVPVRETAAQALAAVLQGASLCSLQRVLQLLACMYTHHEWHVRHGAYTGIKYLLASR
jgi:hypothetical protein